MPTLRRLLRALSGGLFAGALLALAWLLASDVWRCFRPSAGHAQAASLALILAGASLLFRQLGAGGHAGERLKGLLLGLAFVLWGGEHYLPPGPVVTAVDSAVIAIFVIDLGLVIRDRRP